MEEVSHVQENSCSADCFNPLLEHNIGGYAMDNHDEDNNDRSDDDRASVTAPEETVPLVTGISSNPDRLYLIFWASFLSISTLVICLYSTGYLVPGTVLLCCGALLVVGVLAKTGCGIIIGNRRRNLYQEI